MRNLLALFGAAVIAFAGIGWYRGWYTFQTAETAPGQRSFNLNVNTGKVSDDVSHTKSVLGDALNGKKGDPGTGLPPGPVIPASGTAPNDKGFKLDIPPLPQFPEIPPPPLPRK